MDFLITKCSQSPVDYDVACVRQHSFEAVQKRQDRSGTKDVRENLHRPKQHETGRREKGAQRIRGHFEKLRGQVQEVQV